MVQVPEVPLKEGWLLMGSAKPAGMSVHKEVEVLNIAEDGNMTSFQGLSLLILT